MVIYGNNLHEKLFGVAISKDYLKYNTPFCDFVDDPDFEVDIELAVNFNKSINGNTEAARSFTETLILSSGSLDWSTLNFYHDKMVTIPSVFSGLIDEFQDRFNNPANYDDSFQDKLNNALTDCLNSPCNLFAATSDSIGRLAQAASTKTDKNTFGVGALSSSFTNIINGLDQAVFNKIPAIFQNAFTDITQLGTKAVTNTQAILAGKKNLDELVSLAQNGNSMRDTSKTYRYTPDIKTYFDSSAAGSAILTQIKSQNGGCFDKFQHAYRYNPYEDNLSFPMTVQTQQYNGVQYETDAVGVFENTTTNQQRTQAAISQVYTPPKIIQSGETFISETLPLPTRDVNGSGNYSVFAGFIDVNDKIFYVDNLTGKQTGNSDDDLTMSGIGCFGKDILKMCPSDFLKSSDGLIGLSNALNGAGTLDDFPYIVNKYSQGYTHDLTSEGFETIQTGKVFNDGVAISRKLWIKLTGKGFKDGGFYSLSRKNQCFVAARKAGASNNDWKIFKLVDCNTQSKFNVDFTPAAYKHLFGKLKGYKPKGGDSATVKALSEAGWEAKVPQHGDGDMEVKICTGDITQIKQQLLTGEVTDPGGGWDEWLILAGSTKENGGFPSMNSRLLDILVETAKTAGYKLKLISGFRSPEYNARVGGAKNSAHTRRNAVDITVSDKSYDERVRLIQIAINKGITGIGVYNTSLHFDIEGKRAWGPSFSRKSLPRVAWAQPILKQNGYATS